MLVFVNGLAHVVLSFVEILLFSLGQMSVVRGHVLLLRVLNVLLALFNTRGLSRRELAVLHTVGDSLLLARLAAIDLVDAGMPRIDLSRTSLRLCSSGPNKHQTTRCQNYERLRDCVLHDRENLAVKLSSRL